MKVTSPTHSAREVRTFAGGELRVDPQEATALEALGLMDPEAWTRALPGRAVQVSEGRRIHRLGEGPTALWIKLEEQRTGVLGRWVPRPWTSTAAAVERAVELLAPVPVETPAILLAGERRSPAGNVSLLVTRNLPGRPLAPADLECDPVRVQRLVDLVRALGTARVEVPDLYAKHLFLQPETGTLGLLDLDRVRPSARSPRELARRHAAGLVATLPGLDAEAFLEEGASPDVRAELLERVEEVRRRKKMPRGYGARTRYADPGEVRSYQARHPARHRAELALIEEVLPTDLAGTRILDAPCGAGRFSEVLAERGARPLALDLSPAMVAVAAQAAEGAAVGELERLPLRTDAVAGALCFRFLHHVPSERERRRVLAELTRIARRFVILSFFHPISAHHALRRARRLVGGSRSARYAQTVGRLRRELADLGWEVRAVRAQARFRRDLWVLRAEPLRTPKDLPTSGSAPSRRPAPPGVC